ncbi:MAG: cytochrome b [Pseudomonadota bacterium]
MPTDTPAREDQGAEPAPQIYSATARFFHWTTVVLIIFMIVTGQVMTYRGKDLNIWDSLTNGLYSSHKLVGFIVLWFIVARLLYRVFAGAPAHAASLSPAQKTASSVVHWALYALLIAMPLAGWAGVSMFPARDIFGLFSLPALTGVDKEGASLAFLVHFYLGAAIAVFVTIHVTAAIYHAAIARDGVFQRMWPRKS